MHCATIKDTAKTLDERLNATYYDGEWVYYQIADYTKNYSYWNGCAAAAESIYRDQYVIPNNGFVPGYWNFTHGVLQDYLRTGDVTSRNALVSLAQNAAFARDGTPLEWTADSTVSRETAYAIMAYLNAELAGEPRRARLADLVNQALGHLNQWTVSQNAPYVRPFMVSLTTHALTTWYEASGDSRIIPALTIALDWIWDHCWDSGAQAFRYTDRIVDTAEDIAPAPDLNLLIARHYAWLYHHTGQPRFLTRGDQIFAGGVTQAYLNGGKQFDQNYRLSFEFVQLRKVSPLVTP